MTKSQVLGIGIRIKALRKEKKITQEQLAVQVGLTTSAIGRVEINKSLPSLEVFAALCKVLDVTADYLLYGEEATINTVQEDHAKYEAKDEFLKKYVETLERENALLREQHKK